MLTEMKEKFDYGLDKVARENIKKKLLSQEIDYKEISVEDFNKLVQREKDILKHDTKKMGIGIGIGIAISCLIGF
jgi:hypothetical protein